MYVPETKTGCKIFHLVRKMVLLLAHICHDIATVRRWKTDGSTSDPENLEAQLPKLGLLIVE